MHARIPILASALLAACGGALGCGSDGPRARSAVLVTFDTTRVDALGCYAEGLTLTPNLDLLAREGVVFDAAHTVAPLTLPAHASMLTGLYPPRHGLRDNGVAALAPAAETLAERARAAGLQTAAFVGAAVLDPGFGLDQGFEVYDAPRREVVQADDHYVARTGHATVERAVAWLAGRDRGRGFLLWVHLWDPHEPYDAAPPFVARARGNAYLAEVAAADDAFGALMLALEREDVLDETLVIAVADHGEAFLEHGELSHGTYLWQTTLHVPLVVRAPGAAARRVEQPVSVADVAPTIAAALGLAPPAPGLEPDGADLLAEPLPADRGLYLESCYGFLNYGWSPLYGWLDGSWKLIQGPAPRLFAWRADGDEERDLHAARPGEAGRALAALARVAAARPPWGDDPGEPGEPGAALRAAVAALGYAAAGDPPSDVPGPTELAGLPDPLERTAEQLALQEAMAALDAGRLAEAHAAFARVAAQSPRNVWARERAAVALVRAGRFPEAEQQLRALLAEFPRRADSWCQLGACLLAGGRHGEALAAFQQALALDRGHAQALLGAIHSLERLGRGAEAAPLRARLGEQAER